MGDDLIEYAANACSPEPFVATHAVAANPSALAQSYERQATYTPASSASSAVASPGQPATPDASDVVGHLLAITEQIQLSDRAMAGACNALIDAARRDAPRFLAGLALGLARGMLEAARAWIRDIVDLASGAFHFLADDDLPGRVASAGVQALAAIAAVDLTVRGNVDALKTVSALMQDAALELPDDSGVLAQLLVSASHRMVTVAGYVDAIQKAKLSDVLDLAHDLTDMLATALRAALAGVVANSNDAFVVADGVGALMGRVIGEVVLLAIGL